MVRSRWVILSRGERQAKEAMDEGVKRHAAAYNLALESLEYDWVGNETRVKALEVVLPGGSRITALPANPDTARGFSANVFLDEFAFHKDSRAIWKALFPVISAGHKLRVASTLNGKGNKFDELVSASDPAWSRHVVDIHKAVADGLPRDIPALRAAIADDDAWAQEFELKFLDEASAWLSYELISSVEHELAGIPAFYAGGPCFVGVDIAARNDLFVIWVWEVVGDVLWCREIIEERRIKFARQDELLDDVFQRYRVVGCAMDQTGMGERPVEDAQRRHGSLRLVELISQVPHQGYAEPFVGMGGVFLRRPFAPRFEAINDVNRDVATLFRILQRHYVPFMEMLRFQLTGRAEFERLMATPAETLTDLERAARFLYLQRTAFGGKVATRHFGVSYNSAARFNITRLAAVLDEVQARLAGCIIECLPWQTFITRYDRDGMLFYLDPPYWGSEGDYGPVFSRDDFSALAELLAALKGRFDVQSVATQYSLAGGTTKPVRELIIQCR